MPFTSTRATSTRSRGAVIEWTSLVDCDADNAPDPLEIAADPDLDLDGNGVLDACTAHPADLDRDGIVGASDLSLLLDAWGNVGRPTAGLGDLNADGVVDASDLTMFLVSCQDDRTFGEQGATRHAQSGS